MLICNVPMQFLGPYEKGTNAHGSRFATASGRNLSGMNLYGSGQYFSLVWIVLIIMTMLAPAGIMQSPKNKVTCWHNKYTDNECQVTAKSIH